MSASSCDPSSFSNTLSLLQFYLLLCLLLTFLILSHSLSLSLSVSALLSLFLSCLSPYPPYPWTLTISAAPVSLHFRSLALFTTCICVKCPPPVNPHDSWVSRVGDWSGHKMSFFLFNYLNAWSVVFCLWVWFTLLDIQKLGDLTQSGSGSAVVSRAGLSCPFPHTTPSKKHQILTHIYRREKIVSLIPPVRDADTLPTRWTWFMRYHRGA